MVSSETKRPSVALNNLTEVSFSPVAMSLPSGDHATALIQALKFRTMNLPEMTGSAPANQAQAKNTSDVNRGHANGSQA